MNKFKVPEIWTPTAGRYDTIYMGPRASTPKRGMDLVDLAALGILPGVRGGRQGFHVAADVVTQTADGRDLNAIWTDFMALLNEVNQQRQSLVSFLSFPVSQPTEMVAQPGDGVDFEEASEFGQPVGARVAPSYFTFGYTFKWYDLAARYTWQYLADATAQMVDSVANAAVEAYYRLLMNQVLRTVFNPTNLTANINQQAYNVYKFYNADGTVPPTYKTNTFNGTHTHYKTTGAATLDATDLDTLVLDDLKSHGYDQENGYRLVTMVHSAVGNTIRGFRSTANGGTGRYDFIPAQGQPGQIMDLTTQVVGVNRAPANLDGLTVIGTYGPLIIVEEDYMPSTHVLTFATGGRENLLNPVGIREHAQTNLRGLRLVKGRNPDYPLIDSFWAVGFGTGIRHRGGGVVLEITADPTYDPPAAYA
jgi:hypothetical protein